ncbi:hypothetical protein MWU49_00785 [Alcanivorax sp. S6407]|uniref:hypothetical protein n=1 Tax=Alcanivorax sp. S6407 TaxID=2926424 RepID=UPI001FF5257E|nr:hypothetical protein [Alcanivorax sp. S6407]MCK0152227.1 hypothetical protein [Alcanivorax sp. S6407]
MTYLFWAVLGLSLLAAISFYIRMRKVGRLLGGRYQSRMNAALSLLVIIPFFLSLIPDIGNEGLLLVTAISSVLSFSAGAFLLPSVLLDAMGQHGSDDGVPEFEKAGGEESFEKKVQAIRDRQRLKRESDGGGDLPGLPVCPFEGKPAVMNCLRQCRSGS